MRPPSSDDDCEFDTTDPAPDGTRYERRDATRMAWQPNFDRVDARVEAENTFSGVIESQSGGTTREAEDTSGEWISSECETTRWPRSRLCQG